jgi:predicted metal-binding transcription factor (methanogenesis marker protein 9)
MAQSEIEVYGSVIINGKAYQAIKILEALNKLGALSFDIENSQLVLNGIPITSQDRSTRKNALSLLCHHSLAYCCPMSQKCDKRDTALKMLNISPEEYSRIKEEHHLQFLELAPSYSNSSYSETSPSRNTDDVDLSSFFGTPNEEAPSSEKETTDDFLKELLSGNNFESNNLWDNSLNQKEVRYGRKNVPPSTETGTRHLNYTRRCPRCKERNNSENKYCSHCGAELRT